MIRVLKRWVDRYLSDPEAIMLIVFIVGGFGVVFLFGHILMPVFVSIAIAVLLQCWVSFLERYGCPQKVAFWLVFLSFIVFFFGGLLLLTPLLWKQGVLLISELPTFVQNSKTMALQFVADHQDYISGQSIDSIVSNSMNELQTWGKDSVAATLSAIPNVITWVIYLILVPLMVFFFLQDHKKIMRWLKGFLPEEHGIVRRVWLEMLTQMGNYIHGKLTEIFICGFATYLVFAYFGLNYALLLGSLVGLSVVIPYVGAVLVTIPVIIVGYLQWGFTGGLTGDFALMFYGFLIVQFLDSNILVPLLFSEAVNLHPIAIIIAIIFFGALWGFWGVFFAIPLATLVKSVINAWPKSKRVRRRRHA